MYKAAKSVFVYFDLGWDGHLLIKYMKCFTQFLDASSHLYKSQSIRLWVRLSVGPSGTRFFNEPIMGENSRKSLGKQSKCSKLIIKSSELSQNVPKCPKMSTSDASLSEWTCLVVSHNFIGSAVRSFRPSVTLYFGGRRIAVCHVNQHIRAEAGQRTRLFIWNASMKNQSKKMTCVFIEPV